MAKGRPVSRFAVEEQADGRYTIRCTYPVMVEFIRSIVHAERVPAGGLTGWEGATVAGDVVEYVSRRLRELHVEEVGR